MGDIKKDLRMKDQKKIFLNAGELLSRVRLRKPLVHHLTNWVTIYDCANIVKVAGASPVMAHAPEEAAAMSSLASSLVLNIGTLDAGLIESMKLAAASANRKKIPVILDVCGAGATDFRTSKCLELIDQAKIGIIKGNASEIAAVAGEAVLTKGVDSTEILQDHAEIAKKMARKHKCTVVITGEKDVISNGRKTYLISNGHIMMSDIVGTGCMAASCIGAFIAVEKDLVYAASSALLCFEIAAELASRRAKGPASFKAQLFDCLYKLNNNHIKKLQKIERI